MSRVRRLWPRSTCSRSSVLFCISWAAATIILYKEELRTLHTYENNGGLLRLTTPHTFMWYGNAAASGLLERNIRWQVTTVDVVRGGDWSMSEETFNSRSVVSTKSRDDAVPDGALAASASWKAPLAEDCGPSFCGKRPHRAPDAEFQEWQDDVIDDAKEIFQCNVRNVRSDVCVVRGDVRVDARNDVVVLYATEKSTRRGQVKIRPFPRKWEAETMERIHDCTLISVDKPVGAGMEARDMDREDLHKADGKEEVISIGEVDNATLEGTYWWESLSDLQKLAGVVSNFTSGPKGSPMHDGLPLSELMRIYNLPVNHPQRKLVYNHRLAKNVTQNQIVQIRNMSNPAQFVGGSLDNYVEYPPLDLMGRPHAFECDVRHKVPAVLFSTSKKTSNMFHNFNDGLVPLFITIQHYNGEIVLLIGESWWLWFTKYELVIRQLSNYPPVLIGRDPYTHCFADVTVGLKSHGDLVIDPLKMLDGKAIRDFQNAVIRLMRELGFATRVIPIVNCDDLRLMWHYVKASEVLVGVYGEALTNFMFLRSKSSFLQVVPWGLSRYADRYYGEPSRRLGINYRSFTLSAEESSMHPLSPSHGEILTHSQRDIDDTWQRGDSAYTKQKNVTIDLDRLRVVLLQLKEDVIEWPTYKQERADFVSRGVCESGN